MQPDGSGVQFIYLNDGRMISSAKIVGNIADDAMLDLLSTAEGFRKLVHSIGVSVEMDSADKKTVFELQMYGKSDMYGSGTTLRMAVVADGMESVLNLSDCVWSNDDDIPGQIRFVFDEPQQDSSAAQALATVKFYLNDGFSAPEAEEEETVDFACAAYQEMLQKSLVQTGNNARLKTALERAKRGEEITIAFIGGSITQGAGAVPINTKCYAWQTFEGFCCLAGKGVDENIHYIKAGVGGTPSELGMIRFERDVLRDGSKLPDIVIVEFAVNDEGDETQGNCYESLVRKILSLPNSPAVILLFSVFADDWNLQDRLKAVGERYRLPMVSVRDAVTPQFRLKPGEGRVLSKNQFFYDMFHPTNAGHTVMSDCLTYFFEQAAANKDDGEDFLKNGLPEPVIGADYERVRLLDRKELPEGVLVSTGGFCWTDDNLQAVEMDEELALTPEFPNNWMYDGEKEKRDEPFVLELFCRALVLVFKDSGEVKAGRADVFVDGVKKLTADPHINGWIHCNPVILIQEKEAKKHVVQVRMSAGEGKKEFTILGFGYV